MCFSNKIFIYGWIKVPGIKLLVNIFSNLVCPPQPWCAHIFPFIVEYSISLFLGFDYIDCSTDEDDDIDAVTEVGTY